MTSDLQSIRVEEIAEEMGDAPFGSHLKSIHYTDSGALVVQGKNVQGRSFDWSEKRHVSIEKWVSIPRSHCQPGDLIFPKVGTIGKVGILSECEGYEHYLLSTNTMRLRVDPTKADPLYIYYYFTSPAVVNLIHALNSKSVQPVFNYTTLKRFLVELPKLERQKRIAHILGTLDDKIELNRRMNRTLEAMAQALFKSWFVDFDPVKAKAAAKAAGATPAAIERTAMAAIAGRSVEEAIAQEGYFDDLTPSNRASLAQTAALFSDAFHDSELGEIPEGWQMVSFSNLAEINPRRTLKKNSVATYLDMKSVPTEGPSPIGTIQREFKSGTRFINGDTLLARITPCLENGKTAYVDFLEKGETGWGSTEFVVIRPKDQLPVSLGYFFARSEELRNHAIQSMVGTSGRQRVAKDSFDHLLVPTPMDPTLYKELGKFADSVMEMIHANSNQSQTLAQLRDTLLPKLLSGELPVPEAQSQTEEVVS